MRILLTGGAGYIGTHIIVELAQLGHQAIVVDSLVNSRRAALHRVESIIGTPVVFHELDVRDTAGLRAVFAAEQPEAVIHLAGLKAVGESVARPLHYYDVNLNSTLSLLTVMAETNHRRLIFSSSATVYGVPETLPLTESCRTGVGISNPYGRTKYMIEEILRDVEHGARLQGEAPWSICLLRYFNPIGAHPSGLIGEDPHGIPNNLMPYVAQVAAGRRDKVSVFGDNYDTADGTGERDYIHVLDLAGGHVAALEHLKPGVATYNLGTGTPHSVLEMIRAFEAACGKPIPYEVVPRRPGDLAASYCSPQLAERELGWTATRSVAEACRDAWAWQSGNPDGYPDA